MANPKSKMSSGTFVDRIDPFAKRSLKKKQKKSQGSSRYRTGGDVELTALPLLKGDKILLKDTSNKLFVKHIGHVKLEKSNNICNIFTSWAW